MNALIEREKNRVNCLSNKEISQKRKIIYAALWIVFCLTVIVKMALSTAMTPILCENILTKTQVSVIIAAYWFVYALGQPFGGAFADRIGGEWLLSTALLCSAIFCIAFALVDSYFVRLLCWCGVGISQFAVWPSVAVLTSKYVAQENVNRAITDLAYPYPVGNVLGYGISAAILLKFSWKYIFIADALMCLIVLVVFSVVVIRCIRALNTQGVESPANKGKISKQKIKDKLTKEDVIYLLKNGLIVICAVSVLRCMLYTGITTWIPVMFYETKGVSDSLALFFTLLIQAVSMIAVVPISRLLKANGNNEFKTANIMMIASIPFFVLLLFYKVINIWLMLGALIVIIGITCTYGTVVVLQRTPYRYQKYGIVGTISGLTNGFASVGNVISIYGYGVVLEGVGWNGIVCIWLALAILMLTLTLAGAKRWEKFIN